MVIGIEKNNGFCPECGGTIQGIIEKGEEVCSGCGLVVSERLIDNSNSGIRAYSKQEQNKKSRTGPPVSLLLPDIKLSTMINKHHIKNSNFKRIASWDTHLDWETKNMLTAISELKRIGANLNFPDHIKTSTVRIYKKIYKKNVLRGRSIHGMVAACIYYMCKKLKHPLTFQEILEQSGVTESIIKKCYKTLLKELNLKSLQRNPISLIPKYCAELKMKTKLEQTIFKLLKNYCKSNPTSGKDPRGICAGAIYLVAKLNNIKISQKEISDVIGITEVTLRSRYKEIIEKINFVF